MKATAQDKAMLIYTIVIERGHVGITRTMLRRWGFDVAILDQGLERGVRVFCEEYFHRPLFAGDTTTLMCPADLHQRVTQWQAGDNLRNLMHAIEE